MLSGIAALIVAVSPAAAKPTLLFDLQTGQILQHQEAFQRWHPASLTKLMTAYVTFRAIQAGELTLTSPIRVSKVSAKEPPSKMGYKPGAEMTLDNALKMMLVKSANDIAAAVAENVGGTVPDFVKRMNAEAARLGMTSTHFSNPNGLHVPDQYTTARDLAVLVTALRAEFSQYNGYYKIEGLQAGKTVMKGYNKLIGRFEGADGMKTGFVCASGFNLIGTATRNGHTLGAIVLGGTLTKDRAEIAAEMLARGFGSLPTSSPTTIYTLQPYGDGRDTPVDMRDIVCKKPDKNDKKPAASEASEAEAKQVSPYLPEMTRERVLVAVGLGGATGPVPAARAALGDTDIEYADVPVPTWRPDYQPESAKVSTEGALVGG
ncbi:MAG TPA: D-alanyl-D-alanine carboxypeptidase family protein [Rhizobiaceae bacterium]|nr:D-alanyl-D-alanine carboxypeptidase family protein [Rhizobiaceae bacterium]